MFKDFGPRMKMKRQQLNWSLRKLGQECDITAGFLSDIENGKSFPSMEKAAEIARALKVPISWLLGEKELDEVDEMLVNSVQKDSLMYELFLSKHVFPNGLTYKQMCDKIELLEKLQNVLSTNNTE